MYNTGLTEQEKESLIKYLCLRGTVMLDEDAHLVFRFDGDINLEDEHTPAPLLEKAFKNLFNQSRGIK